MRERTEEHVSVSQLPSPSKGARHPALRMRSGGYGAHGRVEEEYELVGVAEWAVKVVKIV